MVVTFTCVDPGCEMYRAITNANIPGLDALEAGIIQRHSVYFCEVCHQRLQGEIREDFTAI